jgi:hypothetical protein
LCRWSEEAEAEEVVVEEEEEEEEEHHRRVPLPLNHQKSAPKCGSIIKGE